MNCIACNTDHNFNFCPNCGQKANVPKINVTFDISADCILTVTAQDTATNKMQSIKISGSVRLSYTEKQNLVNRFENKSNSQIIENQINSIIATDPEIQAMKKKI